MRQESLAALSVKLLLALGLSLPPAPLWAGLPVPSRWQGEIQGEVYGQAFHLPVVIELKKPLPFEQNPLNLFIGAGEAGKDIGHLLLTSAQKAGGGGKRATLQYLSLEIEGSRLRATLTSTHRAEASAINGFSGPNASAAQASELMRDVLRGAWGATEMFAFEEGTTLELVFSPDGGVSGSIQGSGMSYTATSSASYQATLQASRVK